MHDHEIELITGLVDGTLDDETEARALLESSPEARAEYEAQLKARDALAKLAPVTLTSAERAALRRDIWTELRAGDKRTSRWASWYGRIAVAAGALLLLVGLAGVLGPFGAQETAFEIAAESGDDDSAAAQGEEDEIRSADSADTTVPAAETAEAPAADTAEAADGDTSPRAADEIEEIADHARRLREEPNLAAFTTERSMNDAPVLEDCLASAGVGELQAIGDFATSERIYLVAIPEGSTLGPGTPITFVDSSSCEIVHVDG